MSKKVYVMLSGGVDSSVTALILQNEGYELVGVYMKCWSRDSLDKLGLSQDLYNCFWEDDLEDAKSVANLLGIPFEVWDFQEEYRNAVIEYMLREYEFGRTPNPDVMCNSTIKFGIFYEKAMQNGADFVASGHYAKIIKSAEYTNLDSTLLEATSGDPLISRGQDKQKDQSYFLWKIKSFELDHILLPIGKFGSKKEVRELAEKNNLITARKKDSQGLCFVGQTSLRELLLDKFGKKPGDIIDEKGQVLGVHDGAFLYTIGQREKLGLAGGPWFVSKIDVKNNLVFVAHGSKTDSLFSTKLELSEINFFLDIEKYLSFDNQVEVQIRYRQDPQKAILKKEKDKVFLEFLTPIRAASLGQSAVIYHDQIMLGGGIINNIF